MASSDLILEDLFTNITNDKSEDLGGDPESEVEKKQKRKCSDREVSSSPERDKKDRKSKKKKKRKHASDTSDSDDEDRQSKKTKDKSRSSGDESSVERKRKKKKIKSDSEDDDHHKSKHKKKKKSKKSHKSRKEDSNIDLRSRRKDEVESKKCIPTAMSIVELEEKKSSFRSVDGHSHIGSVAEKGKGKPLFRQVVEPLDIIPPPEPMKNKSPIKQVSIEGTKNLRITISQDNKNSHIDLGDLDIPLPEHTVILDVIPLPSSQPEIIEKTQNKEEKTEDKEIVKVDLKESEKGVESRKEKEGSESDDWEEKEQPELKLPIKLDKLIASSDENESCDFDALLSKVIQEVDAHEKLREKYEDGELTSGTDSESDGEEVNKAEKPEKNKKKKKRKERSSPGRKKSEKKSPSALPEQRRNRSRSRSHSRQESKNRSRRSPKSSVERRETHRAGSPRNKSRSPPPRRSRPYRGEHDDRDRSPSRYSPRRERERGHDRGSSWPERVSPRRRRSPNHYDSRRRSHERDYRRKKSPVRPFRVGGPKNNRRSRSRSHSRQRSRSGSPRFDKAKLLKIARQNLEKMKFAGILPDTVTQGDVWKTIQAGGKTVKDLTDFCKRLAEEGDLSSESEDGDKEGIRHPFQLKPAAAERSTGIVQFNIKNAITLPVRSTDEIKQSASKLKEQFPVSSGTTHRKSAVESEWVPVEKDEEKERYQPTKSVSDAGHRMVKSQLGHKHEPKQRETNVVAPMPREPADKVQDKPISISELVAKRIAAMKRFQANTKDLEAKRELEEIEAKTREWVSRKEREYEDNKPPSFIDFSTAPQSWASAAQFANAAPVASGPGLRLLQKMGWQQGEGLGRNKDGTLEPLSLDIKMDKKGLVSREEEQPARQPITKAARTAAGKHPVSFLNEVCLKRRWQPPHFDQVLEAGPDHMKQFLFKVTVNNIDYRPVMASSTKKEAKAQSAAVCLQALGLLPKEMAT